MLQRYTLVTLFLHHITLLLHPYYTMIHPCNIFVASLLHYVIPLKHFCCILIIPCYTPVTLLLHPYNTFAVSLLYLLQAPVMLIFIAIFTCLPSCINLSNINLYTLRMHIKKSLSTELQLSITLKILHAADTPSNPGRFLVHVD